MNGLTLRYRVQSEDIKKDLGVANIEKNMKKNHLKWFRYVQRWSISEVISNIES